jgi:putative heme-binding domain-containing protein
VDRRSPARRRGLRSRLSAGSGDPRTTRVTGLIAGETDAGLTLRRAEKLEEAILRTEIAEITSSGKSLMPDGLEQKIKPEEMADLIAYLKKAT